jgi:hypothetical protein
MSVKYPLHLPDGLYGQVQAAAARAETAAAEWIRRAIREKLERDADGRPSPAGVQAEYDRLRGSGLTARQARAAVGFGDAE